MHDFAIQVTIFTSSTRDRALAIGPVAEFSKFIHQDTSLHGTNE